MSDITESKRSLATDASRLVVAKTMAFGFTFILPLVLVRHLSQVDFGLYRQFFLLVNTAITALPFGFVMSAFYFLPRVGDRAASVAMNIGLVYGIIATVTGGILIIRPSLLGVIFHNPGMTPYARVLGVVLFLAVISSYVDLLALANGDVKGAAMFVVLTNVAKTILLGGAAFFFGSVSAILAASVIHGIFQFALLYQYVKRGFQSLVARFDWALLKKQLGYAVPLGLASWLLYLQTDAHHYFVARAFGPATYAIYAIGCVTVPLVNMVAESLASVLIRRVSEFHSQNRHDEILALIREASRNLAAFYFPVYCFFLVTGRDLIAIVYTPKFISSWPIFAINITLFPLAVLSVINDAVVRSYNECRAFLVGIRLLLVAVLLTSLWLFTQRVGPVGAIAMVVGVNALERLALSLRTARALKLRWRDVSILKDLLPSAAIALAAGVAAHFVRLVLPDASHLIGVIVSAMTFGIVYIASSVVLALFGEGGAIAAWQLAMFRQPTQTVTIMWTRIRGSRATEAAGKKAA
jgi:O-antigen/teichoic acid export membrane protein